jgi:hypothetical protein
MENKHKMEDKDFMFKLNSLNEINVPKNNNINNMNEMSGKKSCPCSDDEIISKTTGASFDNILDMIKKNVSEKDIYKTITLFEFYIYITILIISISTQNTYLALVFLGLLLRIVPEKIIKVIIAKKGGQLTEIAKRPDGAMDCNMFNAGGDASGSSGILSSQTFLISTIAFFSIYKFTNNFKSVPNYKQFIFIGIFLLGILVVSMTRIKLGCHNTQQTIYGVIMGIAWAYLIYYILEIMKNRYSRIADDEEKLMTIFEL